MATEQKRVVKLKRIIDPNDPDPQNPTSFVDIPVITQITFNDPGGSDGVSGGNFIRTFDSTQNNQKRSTHVHRVENQSGTASAFQTDSSNFLDVERIDNLTAQNADQKEVVGLSNNDPPPLSPGDDPALGHLKTHVVRYNKDNTNDPGATPWIDVELIDQIKLKGFLKQRKGNAGQVLTYSLQNDAGESLGDDADPYSPKFSDNTFWGNGLEMLPLDTNGNPDPVRLDPFQNIVNVKWSTNNDFVYLLFRDGSQINVQTPLPSDDVEQAGNTSVMYLIQDKSTIKPIVENSILKGFIVFQIQFANRFYGANGANVKDWTKNIIEFTYTNGPPDNPTLIDEQITLPPPAGLNNSPKLAFPDRGLSVASDSAGTVYANDTDLSKYDDNGNLLWFQAGQSGDWITSQGTNLIVYSQNVITFFDLASGGQTNQIFRPANGPSGDINQTFDNDTSGNAFAVELNGGRLSKYDKNNVLKWTVSPFSLGGTDNDPSFSGCATIDKFVVTTIEDTGYPPISGGDGDPLFNNAQNFAVVVYDENGNMVLQKSLGMFQETFYDNPPTGENGFFHIGGMARFDFGFARKNRYPPKLI